MNVNQQSGYYYYKLIKTWKELEWRLVVSVGDGVSLPVGGRGGAER